MAGYKLSMVLENYKEVGSVRSMATSVSIYTIL